MPLPTLTKDSKLSDVRKAQVEAAKHLIELRSRPTEKRDDAWKVEAREAGDFIVNGDLIEKALAAGERQTADDQRAAANERRQREVELLGPRAFRAGDGDGREFRSPGEQVVLADGYEEWAKNTRGPFSIEVRNLIGEFPNTPQYNSVANGFMPVGSPVLSPGSMQRRRAFVRDLVSVQGTGLKVIPYVREINQVTNETGFQMTAEGSAKPEVTATFELYSAIVEKMAGWLPITDEIVADAPTLMGYINTRLEYMAMIREEQQVMAGTGTSPQIQGLATLSGTQTQAMVTGAGNDQDFPGTIAAAAGKLENVDGFLDGVVANPLDFWVAVGKRHVNQFDNGFGGGAPNTPPAPGSVTWGEPCVRTRAVAAGTAWAGSWRLGCTLFDRETFNVRVKDQHSDWAVRNINLVIGEKRIAVAWHRPALFVNCTVPQI